MTTLAEGAMGAQAAPASAAPSPPPSSTTASPSDAATSPTSTSASTSAAGPVPPPRVGSSSSSRSREREKDRDRDRDRHRSSRDRDGDRSHRSRDGDGDRRDKDRDRRRRHSSRSRSRSPSPSHRTKSSSARSSHRSSRSRSPTRPAPPSAPRPDESREGSERARAELTVFVSQIHPKVRERELFEFFSAAGRVEDVRLIKDQRTRRSKGLGYVEFSRPDEVLMAIAMTGQLLGGYPVTVQPTVYPMSKPTSEAVFGSDSLRLYVGSLQYQITEADLRPIFAAFGDIDSIEVLKDPATGISKGVAFVQYKVKADADMALKLLQGVELAGRPMKLGLATPAGTAPPSLLGASGMWPALSSPSSAAFPAFPPVPQVPTPCLRIANMFDPKEETEADWDVDIAEEMKEEGGKHGPLLHVFVDKNSAGHVFLRFQTVEGATAAFAAFNGRWFGGKQLLASYMTEEEYKARFP